MSTVAMRELVARYVLPATWELLPEAMHDTRAEAFLLAIGLQESRFLHRRQIRGPARGFWQFEQGGGVRGVLTHARTEVHAREAMTRLRYDDTSVETAYQAIAHHDVLACVFARLLLWTLPLALPDASQVEGAWQQYLAAWRPGKPHRETWDDCYAAGWALVGTQTDVSDQSLRVT